MESEHGKLFVGGISQETTEETLKEHFGKYGTVLNSEIIVEWGSGKGRGFGFITFEDHSVISQVLSDEHVILGRTVEVKLAKPKGEKHQNQHYLYHQQQSNATSSNNCNGNYNRPLSRKKIFVGGLPPNLTDEEFKNYFERFGVVTDGVVMRDKLTSKSRGFGFITFDSEEVANNVLKDKFHELNQKHVEVKRAEPKEARNSRQMSTYDCHARGLGFERLSDWGTLRAHLPYPSFNASYLPMPYGSYHYGYPIPAGPSNGISYEEYLHVPMCSHYPSQFPYASTSTHTNTYINYGVIPNGWTTGLGQISNVDGGYLANASGPGEMPDRDGGYRYPTRASEPGEIPNGESSIHEDAASGSNNDANNDDGNGNSEVPAHIILAQPDDDSLCSEITDGQHQQGAVCRSTVCKSR
ncbi:heterogeneous nuclear ribonucleoprotein 1-like [Diospyros lotus]|uniref:heterogeneous nuclear ribonucleoprotein 1-like n=1 Tax=Diospyros lotus TaxID=55363 RepID=UPI0022538C0A|nr:heterogeneous nuclear ribonucleoprotein 1-like [Diospyros lotus]